MTGRYVDPLGPCEVNVSCSPITCVILTNRPLPAEAWRHVETLARAVVEASTVLQILDEQKGT